MTKPRPGVPVPSDLLIGEWIDTPCSGDFERFRKAAAWGADEQLRLCAEIVGDNGWPTLAKDMRSAMRPELPKPLTLKEQALAALKSADGADYPSPTIVLKATQASLIREALETLP
jgi:hypothetical protein